MSGPIRVGVALLVVVAVVPVDSDLVRVDDVDDPVDRTTIMSASIADTEAANCISDKVGKDPGVVVGADPRVPSPQFRR